MLNGEQLTDYLGGEDVAGGKLKEAGTTHWADPNAGANNESGFTALPGGGRNDYGSFYGIRSNGLWWSSTEHDTNRAGTRYLNYDYSDVGRYDDGKSMGFSVRCLRD
ncbi:MAG: FISUMP domain-containing protein [Bacteroidales bacterium]